MKKTNTYRIDEVVDVRIRNLSDNLGCSQSRVIEESVKLFDHLLDLYSRGYASMMPISIENVFKGFQRD